MRQELLFRTRWARPLAGGPRASSARLKRASRIALTSLVTVVALAWLMSRPAFGAALALLQQARIPPLLMALALIPVLQWLRALRFSVLLHGEPRLPCPVLFKLTAQLSALNLALPFKVGDFSFPLLARRALGVGVIHAAAVVLWCRLIDLCVVFGLLLLYAGLAPLPGIEIGARAILLAAAAGFLLAPLAARRALDLLMSLAAAGCAARRMPLLLRLIAGLAESLQRLREVGSPSLCVVVSLAIWLTHGWIGYLAALAVVGDVTFVAAGLAGAASNLAFALPVTGVGGLGPPQAAWSVALQLTGASWEAGVATALTAYGCLLVGSLLTAAATLLFPARGLRLGNSPSLKPF